MRHDRGAGPKLAEARSILKVTFEKGARVGRAAREMLVRQVTERELMALVERHFVPDPETPTERSVRTARHQREDLRHLAFVSPTQEVGRGTAWGALQRRVRVVGVGPAD